MKTPLSSDMRNSGRASSALTNCGRKAKKKIDSLGLRMLIRIAWTITCMAERLPTSFSILRAPCSFSVIHAM